MRAQETGRAGEEQKSLEKKKAEESRALSRERLCAGAFVVFLRTSQRATLKEKNESGRGEGGRNREVD